jgi:magnesium-transporting ATPase (P-type)
MSRTAVLCNDASVDLRDDIWRIHGDPMEGALLIAGMKSGLDIDIIKKIRAMTSYPLSRSAVSWRLFTIVIPEMPLLL